MKEYFRGGYVVSAHVNEMCITNVKISQGFTCNQNGKKGEIFIVMWTFIFILFILYFLYLLQYLFNILCCAKVKQPLISLYFAGKVGTRARDVLK